MKKDYHLIFANPFILNGVIWMFVWLIYSLGWSYLCPKLSDGLLLFIIGSSVISILIGALVNHRKWLTYKPINVTRTNITTQTVFLIILYILFLIEAKFAGGLPLLGYIGIGHATVYKDFGLPLVHVIVVNGLSSLCIFAFYCYKSSRNKSFRRRLIIICLLAFIPFFVMFNRGGIMANLLGIFILILINSKKPLKQILILVGSCIVLLFLFGAAGNLRFGKDGMDRLLEIAEPTDRFEESGIPGEYLWAYLYVSTPLANTQNTIDKSMWSDSDTEDIQKFITYEILPEIVSKRIAGEQETANFHNRARLINPNLTVASIYGRVYNYFGWSGFWILFSVLIAFIVINLRLVSKQSNFHVPLMLTLDIIVILNMFDNMLIFTGLVPQVAIFICCYWISRLKFKNLRRDARKYRQIRFKRM